MDSWHLLEDGVYLYRDSCNVYAVRGRDGQWLIINAGTGRAAAHLPELGDVRDVTVLLTHHFRDHTAGAEAFRRRGARVFAPYGEREHLSDAQQAFRAYDHWLLYNVAWDNFAPIEPLVIERWMRDYEKTTLAGLPVEVIPAPGVSMGAVAYAVELAGPRKVAFIGELMSEPGRLARLSPFQHDYNDLMGGENALLSWHRVLAAGPVAAFPSLGEPFADLPGAVAQLRAKLERYDALRPGFAARLAEPPICGIEEVLPRLYRAKKASAETHFIIGRSGRVLALDYGYNMAGVRFSQWLTFSTRRALLHSLEALQQQTGAGRIDTVLATHYHDDHIVGVPLLQRVFGTELWAGENFADLLEHPADHDRPCLWPEPMRVTRRLPLGETVHWEDVAITLYPMVGHTEFSTLLCLEFDGHRVAHTGDQIFFLNSAGVLVPPQDGGFFSNHVYKNGIALGGYIDCVRHLRAFRPEVIISGHSRPYRPDEQIWSRLEQAATAFDDIHRSLMALGDDQVHFGLESQPAKLLPYDLHLPAGVTSARLRGWVLNPFNHAATADLRFATPPAGWQAAPVRLTLAPREKRAFETTLTVTPTARRRQPIALDLSVDDRPFGQVAEAWVTVGYDRF
ncbi:MAG: MBL fold metallo-hydrolase [Opitutaceae bacterium]|nr:MBL fold metallo-hydrolase [Opitutaceae bacterium]